jgi:cytochrome P450
VSERSERAPVIDLTDAAFWSDVHGPLAAAAAVAPVAVTPTGVPVLLRRDDAERALVDPRLANDYDALLTRHGIVDGPLHTWWKLAMLNTNPPTHTRLRGLVGRAFTPRAVARMEEPVRVATEERLAELDGVDDVEVIRDLAEPLPLRIVCELLGVPRPDHGAFAAWVADLGLMFAETMPDAQRRTAEHAMEELSAFVRDLVEVRRAAPTDDVLTGLVHAEEDGDRLSLDELVAMVVNLLFGGLDTSRGMLATGIWLLHRDDDVVRGAALRSRLRAEPQRWPAVVEEILRFEPPIGEVLRVATEDVEVHGHRIPAGGLLGVSLLAANRDAACYVDPARFDADRFGPGSTAPPPLSFGRGIHHCLGHALARLEGRVVLQTIVEHRPDLALRTTEPAWVPFLRVRRLAELAVDLGPSDLRSGKEPGAPAASGARA